MIKQMWRSMLKHFSPTLQVVDYSCIGHSDLRQRRRTQVREERIAARIVKSLEQDATTLARLWDNVVDDAV